MESLYLLNSSTAILITFTLSFVFLVVGVVYSRKLLDINNYLVANRSIGTLSLSASFIASALGSWVLFGPASAATWGGIGAVIGYALGTAFPLFFLIYLGKKFRNEYPNGKTLTEVIKLKFGKKLFKLILFLSLFYMTIFLIAEVTAVSILIKYISGTDLWITAFIIILCSLVYTIYGGLRASIFTDNIQFLIFSFLIFISFYYLISLNTEYFNLDFIKSNKPQLLNFSNANSLTSGLTFFIAVAATNLFHQGNWQRVYAARNIQVMRRSLIIAFTFIIPAIFFIGFTGLVAVSKNSEVIPDLSFFSLILEENSLAISSVIILLAISLAISSIDTVLNAISSLIIVDGNKIIKTNKNFNLIAKLITIFLCIITFFIASKGLSILYLFLLADLFCCAAAISVFFSFFRTSNNEKNIRLSIIIGLIAGLLFFPSTDFSKSLLIGIIMPIDFFPQIFSNYLLFWSFAVATFLPLFFLKIKI